MSDETTTPPPTDAIAPFEWPKASEEAIAAFLMSRREAPHGRRWCKAHTNNGPRRGLPCPHLAITGLEVCNFHGGKTKRSRATAQRALRKLLPIATDELDVVLTQNTHMPSKLGAIKEVLNRNLGPVEGAAKGPAGPTGPVINIGVRIGGVPQQPAVTVDVQKLPTSDE